MKKGGVASDEDRDEAGEKRFGVARKVRLPLRKLAKGGISSQVIMLLISG